MIVGSRFDSCDQRVQRRPQLRGRRRQLVLDAAVGVHDQQAARARAAEPGQALDVGAQQRVDLGQRLGQHGGDLAREGLPGPRRIAVADQHEIGERAQLAPGGQRIARRRRPTAAARRADPGSRDRRIRPPGAPAPRAPSPTSSTKPSLFSAPAMRGRSTPSPSATRNRSCPPRAALRSTSSGWREPSASAIERRDCIAKCPPRRRRSRVSSRWSRPGTRGACSRLSGRVRITMKTGTTQVRNVRTRPHGEQQRSQRGRLGARAPRPRAATGEAARGGVASWLGARIETAIARLTQRLFAAPQGRRRRRSRRRWCAPAARSRAGSRFRAAFVWRRRRRRPRRRGWRRGGCWPSRRTISASRRRRRARRPRCRRPGGRSRCGWRAGFTVWWRSAAWCASPICAGSPIDDRSPCAAIVDRAPHRRVGARRARGGLVADAVSRRRLAVAQLLPRVSVRLPARRRHGRADLDRGRRAAC